VLKSTFIGKIKVNFIVRKCINLLNFPRENLTFY
jgi:hypothetical protein